MSTNREKRKYPENVYYAITGRDIDYNADQDNPPNESNLSDNITMALDVIKKCHPELKSCDTMIKAFTMYYKDDMTMAQIGHILNKSGSYIGTLIDKMIRYYLRRPNYFYIIKFGELRPGGYYYHIEEEEKRNRTNGIDKLNLSSRAYNCLHKDSIDTIDELIAKSKEYLLGLDNMGQKTFDEIEERLASIGLSLARIDRRLFEMSISELGFDSDLYNRLKRIRVITDRRYYGNRAIDVDDVGLGFYKGYKIKSPKFDTVEDLIRNKDYINYNDRIDINRMLKPMGLSLTTRIPPKQIDTDKTDLLNKLIHELSYEDACRLFLQIRTENNKS